MTLNCDRDLMSAKLSHELCKLSNREERLSKI